MYKRKAVVVDENGTEVKDPDAVIAKLKRRLRDMPADHPKRSTYQEKLASLESLNG